jgi:hypothetical protein
VLFGAAGGAAGVRASAVDMQLIDTRRMLGARPYIYRQRTTTVSGSPSKSRSPVTSFAPNRRAVA